MYLDFLRLKNFMPFYGEHTLKVPAPDEGRVCVVFGDNMRGKTSLLNGLRWLLYGKAYARHMRPIAQVDLMNRDAAESDEASMSVSARFVQENVEYELTRSLTKKAYVIGVPTKDEDTEMTVHLRKDGEPISRGYIEHEIARALPESISRFFLFDGELLQEYEKLLIEQSRQGEAISSAIEQVLGMPTLTNGRDDLYQLRVNAEKRQSEELRQVQTLEKHANRRLKVREEVERLKEDRDELAREQADTEQQIESLRTDLERTEQYESYAEELRQYKARLEESESREAELRGEKKELMASAWKDLLKPKVEDAWGEVKAAEERRERELRKSGARQRDKALLEMALESGECPTCGHNLDTRELEVIRTHCKDTEEGDISGTGERDSDVGMTASPLGALELRKLQGPNVGARIRDIEDEITEKIAGRAQLENRIKEINDKIESVDTDQIRTKRQEVNRLSTYAGELTEQINQQNRDIEAKERDIQQLTNIINSDLGADQAGSSRQVKVYDSLYEIFSRTITEEREKTRERVEDFATKAFKELSTEATYTGLQITTNYGLHIIDPNGETVRERSAGAEQIVALSLIDALNRVAQSYGTVMMDTPLGRLDPHHRQNILKYVPKMGNQVVLLVHEGELDRAAGLSSIKEHVGKIYKIARVSATKSTLEEEAD